MKIRSSVWAISGLLVATAFLGYRVNSQAPSTQSSQVPGVPTETQEQKARRENFQASFQNDVKNNYIAKLNNGSKRRGVELEALPKDIQREAARLALQYKKEIYPKLKSYTTNNGGKLPIAAFTLPEFSSYMQDTQYKGTGEKVYGRGSWSIGGPGYRPDGTLTIKAVYSNLPGNVPHDIWASYTAFQHKPNIGDGFTINGWDDGQVTFDLVAMNYFGMGKSFMGQSVPMSAVPGQAGIPPHFVQGVDKWLKKQTKQLLQDIEKQKKAAEEAKEEQKKKLATKQQ